MRGFPDESNWRDGAQPVSPWLSIVSATQLERFNSAYLRLPIQESSRRMKAIPGLPFESNAIDETAPTLPSLSTVSNCQFCSETVSSKLNVSLPATLVTVRLALKIPGVAE